MTDKPLSEALGELAAARRGRAEADRGGGGVSSTAAISHDGLYRWSLERRWDHRPSLGFVMLNPSTADADVDDPTIRRCIGFAQREGHGGIYVVNLYALRATKPAHLLDYPDPEGHANVGAFMALPERVVVAYGAHVSMGGLPASKAAQWLRDEARQRHILYCLGITKDGHPRHPLYVRGDTPLLCWPSLCDPEAALGLIAEAQ
jgi:hypothetical protein